MKYFYIRFLWIPAFVGMTTGVLSELLKNIEIEKKPYYNKLDSRLRGNDKAIWFGICPLFE